MSLETRIVAAVQAIGLDVKALFARSQPAGGTAGQVLTKTSSTDYDSNWQTPAAGGGPGITAPQAHAQNLLGF